MKAHLFILMALVFTASPSQAKVKLSRLVSDNMVIQQNTDARLWGTDTPGKNIKVTVSWSGVTYHCTADKSGKWLVKVKTPVASFTPYSITFDDGEPVTVSGVVSGEVWVGAGQSNMEMPIKGFSNCPVEGYNQIIANGNDYSGIHYCKVPSVMSMTPLDTCVCQWKVCSQKTVGDASATAFFFARLVSKTLNIPVGIIEANKGGTRVESWLNEENLKKYTDEDLNENHFNRLPYDFLRPLVWGNGTFHPIINYTVKGIIWYQGCSNVGYHTDKYAERLALLVKQMRDDFGLGNIPFYEVQIAPYFNDDVNGTVGAYLREQQYKAVSLIPNSGIVGTNDAVYPYETQQIHPTQKQKVGERLGFYALRYTYSMDNIIAKGPSFKEMRISNDSVFVRLQDDTGGVTRYEDIQGFEVAGEDRVFHPITATYNWTKGIIITSPEVKKPVAVRYCFRNFKLGNLGNMGGLPLFPFRTDNW
ncbi:MAG: 9-O-acetylesterase [Bacteroidaceae bacterium]|nr:9-O-acetylesterase [Bacteroidaceae bacterium]